MRGAAAASWTELQSELDRMRYAVEHVAPIEQARGALMATFGMSADDAGMAMQHEVEREHLPLLTIAERVMAQLIAGPATAPPDGALRREALPLRSAGRAH
jgi:AmiR/NasT family two-component response regulator